MLPDLQEVHPIINEIYNEIYLLCIIDCLCMHSSYDQNKLKELQHGRANSINRKL